MSTKRTGEDKRPRPVVDRIPLRRRRRKVVLDAEVKLLLEALAPFGLLSREELIRRTDAGLWGRGSFDAALQAAVDRGAVKVLPDGCVVLHRRGERPPR